MQDVNHMYHSEVSKNKLRLFSKCINVFICIVYKNRSNPKYIYIYIYIYIYGLKQIELGIQNGMVKRKFLDTQYCNELLVRLKGDYILQFKSAFATKYAGFLYYKQFIQVQKQEKTIFINGTLTLIYINVTKNGKN